MIFNIFGFNKCTMFKRNKDITKSLQIGNNRIPRDYYIEISEYFDITKYEVINYLRLSDHEIDDVTYTWWMQLLGKESHIIWDKKASILTIYPIHGRCHYTTNLESENLFDVLDIIKNLTHHKIINDWIEIDNK